MRLLYILIFSVLLSSCKKDKDSVQPFLGYSYFPLEVGDTRYYQVDSIGWLGYTFNEVTMTVEIDTVNYEIMEVTESFFLDNEGRETARIVRYRRPDSTHPWTIYKVYAANITAVSAERLEDNIRYTKLVFPPSENEKWIGQYVNSFFPNDTSFDAWEYEYTTVNEPMSLNNLSFDSTLTVVQQSDANLIEFRLYREQYAAGTGMILKEYSHYDYPSTSSSFIKNGFIYKETLTGYN